MIYIEKEGALVPAHHVSAPLNPHSLDAYLPEGCFLHLPSGKREKEELETQYKFYKDLYASDLNDEERSHFNDGLAVFQIEEKSGEEEKKLLGFIKPVLLRGTVEDLLLEGLTLEERREYTKAFLESIILMHERIGYIHGDLALDNAMISSDGIFHLIDFCFAEPLPKEAASLSYYRRGKAGMIAPECFETSDRRFNAKERQQVEMFTVGILIYELFVSQTQEINSDINSVLMGVPTITEMSLQLFQEPLKKFTEHFAMLNDWEYFEIEAFVDKLDTYIQNECGGYRGDLETLEEYFLKICAFLKVEGHSIQKPVDESCEGQLICQASEMIKQVIMIEANPGFEVDTRVKLLLKSLPKDLAAIVENLLSRDYTKRMLASEALALLDP